MRRNKTKKKASADSGSEESDVPILFSDTSQYESSENDRSDPNISDLEPLLN